MDYSFRLKRAHNSHHQNETHARQTKKGSNQCTKKDTETSKSIKAKLSIQYKMLLESLKSVFLFSHVFFSFSLWHFFFHSCCYCCLWGYCNCSKRHSDAAISKANVFNICCCVLVVFVIFGCFGNAILLVPSKEIAMVCNNAMYIYTCRKCV